MEYDPEIFKDGVIRGVSRLARRAITQMTPQKLAAASNALDLSDDFLPYIRRLVVPLGRRFNKNFDITHEHIERTAAAGTLIAGVWHGAQRWKQGDKHGAVSDGFEGLGRSAVVRMPHVQDAQFIGIDAREIGGKLGRDFYRAVRSLFDPDTPAHEPWTKKDFGIHPEKSVLHHVSESPIGSHPLFKTMAYIVGFKTAASPTGATPPKKEPTIIEGEVVGQDKSWKQGYRTAYSSTNYTKT